jgi:hypothetical protein
MPGLLKPLTAACVGNWMIHFPGSRSSAQAKTLTPRRVSEYIGTWVPLYSRPPTSEESFSRISIQFASFANHRRSKATRAANSGCSC